MIQVEPDTRVRVVCGPHRYCTGIVQSITHDRRRHVDTATVALDSSGRTIVVDVDEIRREVEGWVDPT